jgi:hypothetical protein
MPYRSLAGLPHEHPTSEVPPPEAALGSSSDLKLPCESSKEIFQFLSPNSPLCFFHLQLFPAAEAIDLRPNLFIC